MSTPRYNLVRVTERQLAEAGWISAEAALSGAAEAFTSDEYPTGYRHTELDMMKGRMVLAPEPAVAPEPVKPPTCTVDGVQVVELAVMFKPLAHLVTTSNGVHELTRCYFQNGKFAFGVDMTRIGGISATGVEYSTTGGLHLHLDKGYELFIPAGHCQASWRLPDSV